MEFRTDGSCSSLSGDVGTWTLDVSDPVKIWEIRWESGYVDRFELTETSTRVEGTNNRGSVIRFDKIPHSAEIPIESFLGTWHDSRDSKLDWLIEPEGIAYGVRYSDESRSAPASKTRCVWRRGPAGNQITVLWEGNPKWFNVITAPEGSKHLDHFNQRGRKTVLKRAEVPDARK
jgi:hypothetical protein